MRDVIANDLVLLDADALVRLLQLSNRLRRHGGHGADRRHPLLLVQAAMVGHDDPGSHDVNVGCESGMHFYAFEFLPTLQLETVCK